MEQIDITHPLTRGFFDVFRIPTRRTVTQWADEERMLPSKGAAEPGKYRSARTPYLVEPMDCLSTLSPIEETIIMAAAQTGKSESGNNWVGSVIDDAPGPMLLVQPTVDNAKRYSKQRIAPMILETPSLAKKVIENKSRDSGNTMLEKEFPGGILILGGANSAAGLRSMPIRYLFADEISNWPDDVDGEGDPLALAEQRTNTFGRKRKILKTSTPGVKGVCRIEREFLRSDQRRYFVPCPHCGHMHHLEWKNFVIPKDDDGKPSPQKSFMACPDCGGVIEERHKTDMLRGGEWRATAPQNADPTRRGYHINALYSPIGWKSWAKVGKEWVEAQGHPQKLKAFVNNVLAETWEEDFSQKVDADGLQKRAEGFRFLRAPNGVLFVTSGVDVQDNRIEIQTIGWGIGEEAWVLNYAVIYGSPDDHSVWSQVLDVVKTPIVHASGAILTTYATCCDSGDGDWTNQVYMFARDHKRDHVLAIKGMPGTRPPIGQPSPQDINIAKQKIKNGAALYPVGVDGIKSTIYSRLKKTERDGAAAIHFSIQLEAEYYKQLTAEVQKTKFINGLPKKYWFKKDGDRNEALDTFVYAYAALHYAYSRHNRATFWQQMQKNVLHLAEECRGRVQYGSEADADNGQAEVTHVAAPPPKRGRLSGWSRQ